MTAEPIYDWSKSFEDNLAKGPSPDFRSSVVSVPSADSSFALFGLRIGSRFGSAACPAGSDDQFMYRLLQNGYDIVTTKTRRSTLVEPNPMPNLIAVNVPAQTNDRPTMELVQQSVSITDYETLSLVNSFGNNSLAPQSWMKFDRKLNAGRGTNKLIITSIVGTIKPNSGAAAYYEDFALTAELAVQTGARAIEVNLSCPNVANEAILCYDTSAVLSVCKIIRSRVGILPVIAKIGYFDHSQQELLRKIIGTIAPYINGVSAINTIPVNVAPLQNNESALHGGLSGFPLRPYGLDMVRRLAKIRESEKADFVIFGMGGVLNPEDYKAYRQAGADVVESASGTLYNPNLALEIKNSI